MKSNWQTKKLGDLCEIELGKTPARANKVFWDEKRETDNIWLSIADLLNANDNIVVDSKEYLSDKGAAISKTVRKGTLLVSFKLTLGRLAFAGRDLFTNEAIAALTIFNEREMSKEFLFYFLHFFDWRKAAENDVKLKGMTLNKAKLKEMDVHFPPFCEQKRIVNVLDEVFEKTTKAKENAEKNLQNARELFESYLQNIFANPGDGWEENMLEEIGETQTGTTPKTVDKENYGNYIPFITPADIDISGDGTIRYREEGLSEKGLENGRKMKINSILMVCIGASIGKVGFVDRDVSCNQQVNSLTVKKGFCSKFFYYALSTKGFFERVIKNSAQATLPIINKGKWEKLTISYPPSEKEQQFIVAKLDTLSAETKKLEAIYQQKLADLEELKKSLLQKAFNGELAGACS